MSSLQLLNFDSNEIRTIIGEDRALWFVAQDVCKVLDISNISQACEDIDSDEKRFLTQEEIISKTDNPDVKRLLAISEAGFYQLVFKSRKPEAKAFQKWVTKEVIPAIRATGTYKTEAQIRLDRWIDYREKSKLVSQLFTKECKRRGYNAAHVHNKITIAVMGMTAKQLCEREELIHGAITVGLNHVAEVESLELICEIKLAFASASLKGEGQDERLNRIIRKMVVLV